MEQVGVDAFILGGIDMDERQAWLHREKFLRGKLFILSVVTLVLLDFAGLATQPAAAQPAVPPGLVLPIGNTIQIWNSTDVNAFLATQGYTNPPFPDNQGLPQTMPTQLLNLVRVYNPAAGSYAQGRFIMPAQSLRGLTPVQIRDVFALPAIPTDITLVRLPANVAALWTGIAAPIAQYGPGGAQQSFLIGSYPGGSYPFPVSAFVHPQPLGPLALSYALPLEGRGNAGKIGAYLDRFLPAPYSDLENVYNTLDFLNWVDWGTTPLQNALNQISPERFSSLSSLGQRNSLLFGDALLQRSQSLRQGLAGGELSGGSLGEGLGRLAQLAYVCGFSDPRQVSPTLLPSQTARRGVGLWARGVGEFGNQASGSGFTGFGYHTGGVVGGIDWQPRRDLILGFGTAYLGSDLNWNNSGGTALVNNAKFGLYATYFTPRFFLDGVFTGGVNWTHANRRITILSGLPSDLAIDRNAASSSTGHDLALHLQGGVNLPVAGWDLTPLARLSYFYHNQDGFSEQGADSLNLTVQGFSAQTLRSQLGLRLGRTFGLPSEVKLRPEVQVGWAHDFPLDNRVINAGLTVLGGTFAVNGFRGETDSLLLGAGLTAQLTSGVAVTGRYAAELRRGFQAQMVNLGLRFDF